MITQTNQIGLACWEAANWNKISLALRARFPHLTSSDLVLESGRQEELLARLELKLNRKREDLLNIINDTCHE